MNKQQLCLVLDQIDPRYLDEAAGYRGRSPKRAARALLIAAVILLLGAIFSVGAFSGFRVNHLRESEYIRSDVSGKTLTLNDGTTLNLTYGYSEDTWLGVIDTYLRDIDQYSFRNGILISYNAITSAGRAHDQSPLPPKITREEALRIGQEHLALYYDVPEEYRFQGCVDYNQGDYSIRYTLYYGDEYPIWVDDAVVTVNCYGYVMWSGGPEPARYEGFDPALLEGISEEDMENFAKDQIIAQYGEDRFISCDLHNASLQKNEEGTVQLIVNVMQTIRDETPYNREFVYPLE